MVPKLLLFSAAALIAASAVVGAASRTASGALLIPGGILLVLAGRVGVADVYVPPQMPTKNVRSIGAGTVALGCFFAAAGIAVLLTQD